MYFFALTLSKYLKLQKGLLKKLFNSEFKINYEKCLLLV